MTWDEFEATIQKDMASQNYKQSVSECCGVLGKSFIMETVRINNNGDVYCDASFLVTINDDFKIIQIEAFSDVNAPAVLSAVSASSS